VKSILANLGRSKKAIKTIWEALKFNVCENFTLRNVKKYQKIKIQSCSNGLNDSFWGFKMTKMDFA